MALVATVTAASDSRESPTVLSNLVLPKDTTGRALITGEADVLAHNGSYYFYFNNWATAPGWNVVTAGVAATRAACYTMVGFQIAPTLITTRWSRTVATTF